MIHYLFLPHLRYSFFLMAAAMLFVFASARQTQAQNAGTVKGMLADSASRAPLASLACVLSAADSANTGFKDKVVLSAANGSFVFTGVPKGVYTLQVKVFNYFTLQKTVRADSTLTDLGPIYLSLKSNVLAEVQVVSGKLITQQADRISYNVENDLQSKSASTIDMMAKVPMLSTDANDNIKYLGTNAYRIMIDGKPALSGNSVMAYLRTLPASAVKKIEVITNPSGRYMAEGVQGVINVVTKKKEENGLEGSVSFEHRFPANGPGLGLRLAAKTGKFGFNFFAAPSAYRKPFTETGIERQITGVQPTSFSQFGGNETTTRSIGGEAGISYEKDSLNLFSLRIEASAIRNIQRSDLGSVLSGPGLATQSYRIANDRVATSPDYAMWFDYQRNFSSRKAKTLNLSYLFIRGRQTQNDSVGISEAINFSEDGYNQFNRFRQREHTVQADFTDKPGAVKIDAGLKAIARFGESDFATTNVPRFLFMNDQYILSAYNAYQGEKNKFSYTLGYRFEYTDSRVRPGPAGAENAQRYLSFLPNLAFDFKANAIHSFHLNYIRSLRRPNISYLNPFVNRLNPNLEVAGNPALLPVKEDKYTLQYRRIKKSSFIASLSYLPSRDVVQQLLSNTGTPGVNRITYGNVGRKNDFSLNLSYNASLSDKLNLNASATAIRTSLSGSVAGQALENRGYTGDVNLGLGYAAMKRLFLNGRFSYNFPLVTLQGRQTFYPYFLLGAAHNFLDDKLSLGFRMFNPFSKFRNITSEYLDQNIIQIERVQNFYRLVSLTGTYRFGLLKKQNRSNRKSIQNSDRLELRN